MCVCVCMSVVIKLPRGGHIEQYFNRVYLNMDLEVNIMQIKGGN